MPPKSQKLHPSHSNDNSNNDSNDNNQHQHSPHKKKKKQNHGPPRHNNHNRNPNASLKSISHALSWALRHAAPQLKLRMTSDGYCPVQDLLACKHPKLSKITSLEDHIRPVVDTNDKQRFRLELRPASLYDDNNSKPTQQQQWSVIPLTPEQAAPVPASLVQASTLDDLGKESATAGEPSSEPKDAAANTPHSVAQDATTVSNGLIWCIRANQGHSLKGIEPEYLLQEISRDELAHHTPVIVHGTYFEAWRQIQASGALSRRNRTHIHCAAGLPQQDGVISGMRASCQVLIYLSAPRCAAQGVRFFRSDNGVLLTAGVQDQGLLPLLFVSHVVDRDGNVLLDQRDETNDQEKDGKSSQTQD